MSDITRILQQLESDAHASEQLLPLVYDELRRLATARLANERAGQTIQATALVHEAFLRLVDVENQQKWNSKGHFFSASAEAMRRILVENARRKKQIKRGGNFKRREFEEGLIASPEIKHDLLALDEALTAFSEEHPEKCELVKLRYFAGLTIADAAKSLDISTSTADRHWSFAKAWLYRFIGENAE